MTTSHSKALAITLYCIERGAIMTGAIGGYEANKLEVASPERYESYEYEMRGGGYESYEYDDE